MFGDLTLILLAALLALSVWLRQPALFVIVLGLGLTDAASRTWRRWSLRGVEYRRHLSQARAFFGEEVELTVEMVNRKPLPLAWLQAEDEVPCEVTIEGARLHQSYKPHRMILTNVLSLRWFERVRRRYRVRCDQRGEHVFGPAVLRSGDLFGIFHDEVEVPQVDRLVVYPRVVPVAHLGLPSHAPLGDLRGAERLFEDPSRLASLRDYRPDDDPRRLEWKATARSGNLTVKVFEPSTTHRLYLFLNLNTYAQFWWMQRYYPDLLELAIMATASIANWALEQGLQVGLYANGNARRADRRVALPPSRSPQQLPEILDALARVLPFATMPVELLLAEEGLGLPWGSTVVLVTAVITDPLLEALEAARGQGRSLALILVGDHMPHLELPGVAVRHVRGEEAWRAVRGITVA